MKYIDLTNSDKNVIVDNEDYDYLKNFSDWYLNPIGYVTATFGNGKWKMHLLIAERFLEWDKTAFVIDHKDRDTLNNIKANLRVANFLQNRWNSGLHSNNNSGYKGVCFHKKLNKWQATIMINYKRAYLGIFDSARDAAICFDIVAKYYCAEFAFLNFPKISLHEIERVKTLFKNQKLIRNKSSPYSSRYKGIYWSDGIKNWRVDISYKTKRFRLGSFKDEIEAARKYDEKCFELCRFERALNFPEDYEQFKTEQEKLVINIAALPFE